MRCITGLRRRLRTTLNDILPGVHAGVSSVRVSAGLRLSGCRLAEKHYVNSWVLYAIAPSLLGESLVFKRETALSKCISAISGNSLKPSISLQPNSYLILSGHWNRRLLTLERNLGFASRYGICTRPVTRLSTCSSTSSTTRCWAKRTRWTWVSHLTSRLYSRSWTTSTHSRMSPRSVLRRTASRRSLWRSLKTCFSGREPGTATTSIGCWSRNRSTTRRLSLPYGRKHTTFRMVSHRHVVL